MNTQNIDSTQNIDNIMKKMTLEEKISLLTGSESMAARSSYRNRCRKLYVFPEYLCAFGIVG